MQRCLPPLRTAWMRWWLPLVCPPRQCSSWLPLVVESSVDDAQTEFILYCHTSILQPATYPAHWSTLLSGHLSGHQCLNQNKVVCLGALPSPWLSLSPAHSISSVGAFLCSCSHAGDNLYTNGWCCHTHSTLWAFLRQHLLASSLGPPDFQPLELVRMCLMAGECHPWFGLTYYTAVFSSAQPGQLCSSLCGPQLGSSSIPRRLFPSGALPAAGATPPESTRSTLLLSLVSATSHQRWAPVGR